MLLIDLRQLEANQCVVREVGGRGAQHFDDLERSGGLVASLQGTHEE